jgi:chaperone required for assembly of F1-ATPase
MMQLAATALDRAGPERPAITDQLLAYAGTDLLCYRADFPPDLSKRQVAQWQPLLDWAAQALDAPLVHTCRVIAVEQPAEALAALRNAVDRADVWTLTAIQAAAAAAGSLVLALALAEGRVDGETCFALSQLDETYQIEQWGEDYEAADRRAALKRDILSAERFLMLVRDAQ